MAVAGVPPSKCQDQVCGAPEEASVKRTASPGRMREAEVPKAARKGMEVGVRSLYQYRNVVLTAGTVRVRLGPPPGNSSVPSQEAF